MFAQREETKLIAIPYEAISEEIVYEDIEDWLKWLYSLDLKYRYAILSRGIQYES